MDEKSKVYILVDDLNRVLRCEGGYTMGNIADVSEWIFIDEGEGDKYNLCQSQYFPGGLFSTDGIAKWKYVDGELLERTLWEMEADRQEQKNRLLAAPRNITAGEYISVNGTLYKATANIPNGGCIINGQNAIETTYEAQLYELAKKGE